MAENPWAEDRSEQDVPMKEDADRLWLVLEKTLERSTIEQRRARRWGIFFKSIILLYIIGLSLTLVNRSELPMDALGSSAHTAVVPVDGVISSSEAANAFDIQQNLEAAFEAPGSKGVMLEINSPGGSPVQSEYVFRAILDLKAQYPAKPVHAVIGDIGASGAYYIAAAADTIHAAPASIIGSIGVLSSGFGFHGLMEKLGIDRRVTTAGDNKAMLDPFLPESEDDKAHLQSLLDATHRQFVARVQEGRGDRLTPGDENIFDGRVWTGEQALILGLVDSLAGPLEVAREWIGAEKRIYYTKDEPILDQLSREFGFGVGRALTWLWRQGILNPWSLSH
ncbi:MAG: S49 family peptidase [Pseudomonadota bacterium]|nr:S49 family peptidase [Pseudomonadota bacterium]